MAMVLNSSSNNAPADNLKFSSFGISTALVTPFDGTGSIVVSAAERHASRVIDSGASGITLFGTTGEGASLGPNERYLLLDSLIGKVVSADMVTVCVCACNLEDAIAQARQACGFGINKLLVTPPFYFNGVADEGIILWYQDFIAALKYYEIQLILYNLPQVTQVELSGALIRRLKDRFGDIIFGVKDSSGSWESALEFLENDDLAVLIGDERLLAKAGPLGCAGAISGMANLFPGVLRDLVLSGNELAQVNNLVSKVVSHPVTPLVKRLVAINYEEDLWMHVRPPLLASKADNINDMVTLVTAINCQL